MKIDRFEIPDDSPVIAEIAACEGCQREEHFDTCLVHIQAVADAYMAMAPFAKERPIDLDDRPCLGCGGFVIVVESLPVVRTCDDKNGITEAECSSIESQQDAAWAPHTGKELPKRGDRLWLGFWMGVTCAGAIGTVLGALLTAIAEH